MRGLWEKGNDRLWAEKDVCKDEQADGGETSHFHEYIALHLASGSQCRVLCACLVKLLLTPVQKPCGLSGFALC